MAVPVPSLRWEAELLRAHPLVIACDEVGRGSLAGPVAVGAASVSAAQTGGPLPEGLRDSKLVPERRRPDVAARARDWADATAVGWATATEVDEVGIIRALGLAAHRAIGGLRDAGVAVSEAIVILDGNHDYITPVGLLGAPVVTRVKADQDCASAAAASVVAKTERDAVMVGLHEEYPVYAWDRNKGYASQVHRDAIAAHGLSRHHRASWAIASAPALF